MLAEQLAPSPKIIYQCFVPRTSLRENPKSGKWINQGLVISRIHTQSGYIRSNLNPDSRIHDLGVSLGDGSKNSASVKQSSMQIYWSCHIFSRSCVTKHLIMKKKIQVIIPFRIFEKFSPKVQTCIDASG